MKSEKVTAKGGPTDKRWYDDACGAAHGLELVGERWALLIVRELMFGPRRFGAIRAMLHGISANVLTQRLEGLEEAGIVRHRQLPAPASVFVYELTEWGLEAEPIFISLGRWAARSPRHDPTLPLSPASIMLSFRSMFDAKKQTGQGGTLGFRFPHDAFVVVVDGGGLHARRQDPHGADACFDTDTGTLGAVVYGGLPLQAAEATGTLRVSGDRALAEAFPTWFALPPKAPAAVD